MLEIGTTQILRVTKVVDFGVYLTADGEEEVLLPRKQVPADTEAGDSLEVFLYRDSKDRLIATTNTPLLQKGGIALLKVKEAGKIGAFLDWGLEKDLLLPFREQTGKVQPGQEYLVSLYEDKSGRLCATMKIYHYLETGAPYKKDDVVEAIIYEISDEFGVFAAVDQKYSARISKQEAHRSFRPGDRVMARVLSVREDGKLELSIRKKSYLQMDEDAELIMAKIEQAGGVLPFTDKAEPELIKREFALSKNAFKRAVGRLLKEGKVEITDQGIRKIQ